MPPIPRCCPSCGGPLEDIHIVQDATVTFTLSRSAHDWTTNTPSLNYLQEIVAYAQPCNCELDGEAFDAAHDTMTALGGFDVRPQ